MQGFLEGLDAVVGLDFMGEVGVGLILLFEALEILPLAVKFLQTVVEVILGGLDLVLQQGDAVIGGDLGSLGGNKRLGQAVELELGEVFFLKMAGFLEPLGSAGDHILGGGDVDLSQEAALE